ncbi:hypothetical protein EDB84DRAFT_1437913 [Lactarius hengduanensis]|nr:hypothetical protein EDB84DRAFT_1440822 [Lactarius hengduanensis]KAH9035410.1 hypothetical protein EDB84DRAFT_1437913 [Lactarius hengduanensis]
MDIDVGGHGGGGGVGLVMSNRRSSAACTVSVVVVARLRSSLPLLPSPRGRRRCLRRHSSVVTAIHRCVVLTVATLGVVLTIVVVILAVTVVVILSVVVVGVVLTPLLPVARLHTHAPGLGHASRRLGTEDPAWLEYRGDERQGKSSKNGFKFSVHTRSAGSVAWHSLRVYASRAGAGSRGRSPVGRNVWAGEVVCCASMVWSATRGLGERRGVVSESSVTVPKLLGPGSLGRALQSNVETKSGLGGWAGSLPSTRTRNDSDEKS